MSLCRFFFTIILLAPIGGRCATERLVIGGRGQDWRQVAQLIVALDDTVVPGALQTIEIPPGKNILVGPRTAAGGYTNLFGARWEFNKVRWSTGFILGVHPRFWRIFVGDYEEGPREFIDGDPSSTINIRWIGTGSSEGWTFDFGFPIPINRVVFFPPQTGLDTQGNLYRNDFPRAYEISGAVEPKDYLLVTAEERYHTLDKLLVRTFNNGESIVNVTFPTQPLRFLRLGFGLTDQVYTLAEIQVFGEGFPPVASYTSTVVDVGRPVNFGRILWGFTRMRKDRETVIPDSTAPVSVSFETRTGLDDSPLIYHIVTDIGREKEVSEAEYKNAVDPSARIGPRPGNKGSVTDDLDHWSFWSSPYRTSGMEISSPDGRRYLQFKTLIKSEEIFAFGRLDSLVIEYTPLLAKRVIGEVALQDLPNPLRGIVEVPAGLDMTFTYDIQAEFDSPDQAGFDGVRVTTESMTKFLRLEIGTPLTVVKPDSVVEGDRELVVYFPSYPITGRTNRPIRVTFQTAVLSFSSYFSGEVIQVSGENLPQSIDPGNANDRVTTDDTRVFIATPSLEVLSSVTVSPEIMTPNGDGLHDTVTLIITTLGVEQATGEVLIYTTAGVMVRRVVTYPTLRKGIYTVEWDGRNDRGGLVPPGIYLCKIVVDTDSGRSTEQKILPVVY
jgi:hypothetical protein